MAGAGRCAGMGPLIRPFVIAEIGEHPHDWQVWLHAAAEAGADAVKVQLWQPQHFPPHEREAKAKWEFPRGEFAWFVADAHSYGLKAGASVFDLESCNLVASSGADFLKLACREEDNLRLRLQCWLVHGMVGPVYRSVRATRHGARGPRRLPGEIPLGCVPEYPAVVGDQALFWHSWPRPKGWSSHARGWLDLKQHSNVTNPMVPDVVERHLGPEPWASTAREFEQMVRWYGK